MQSKASNNISTSLNSMSSSSERLYRSFYRNVPLPEEIIPSKVSAKVDNGILKLDLPKKNPTESESQATRVDVK